MIIASVKVLLLFSIVDIISNCQTVIIDNYTKNKDRLAIIIWFHRPVLSYNKRQSRTGQMCSHMIFISFFVGNKFGASKECVHNSPVNLRKPI
jgi:hypothetical protein